MPYPRLGLTAHIQFTAEGATVLGAGLALQLQPFGGAVRLVDQPAAWQRRVVYWDCSGVRVTLLSEVANSWRWWGMRDVLPFTVGEVGKLGCVAGWQEGVVMGGRHPPAVMMAAEWPIIVYELFTGPKEKRKA